MKVTCICGNEMNVDDSMRGKRGKCPKCKSLILVPEFTEDEMIFDDEDIYGTYAETKLLYDQLNLKYKKRIDYIRINSFEDNNDCMTDSITLTLKTGKYNERTQTVMMCTMQEGENPARDMLIWSSVGDIYILDDIDYPDILRLIRDPKINIYINDDDVLQVHAIGSLSNDEIERTSDLIVNVAVIADLLEKMHSDSDNE
jgi:hypothetical protein